MHTTDTVSIDSESAADLGDPSLTGFFMFNLGRVKAKGSTFITLGAEGMMNEESPSVAAVPGGDAIGAGDAFFAFIAPCFAGGMSQDLVSFVGNAVGSLAVQIVCNREPVNFVDLVKFITRLLK